MTVGRGTGIEIRGVNLSYGATQALRGVDLSIRPGEFFAFLGPSGCGKTTLLRLLAGFNRASSGAVLLDGADITALPPWQRDVGMVFQSYALWPHLTVARNVAFGLEERREPRAAIVRKVEAALALVGLQALAGRYPSELSGGQQQRVAIARTIAVEPKVLLLDEPLSNLDANMRVAVRRELRDLQRRLGITTIFVTHDQEEANAISDRIAVMRDGRVQQVGTPMELYEHPANLFVAGFLGTANILEGRLVQDGAARAFELPGGLRLAIGAESAAAEDARLVFRPQHARLVAPAEGGIAGTIKHREFLGAAVRYGIDVGGRELLVEAPFASAAELRETGAAVAVAVDPARLRFIPP